MTSNGLRKDVQLVDLRGWAECFLSLIETKDMLFS